MNATHAFNVDLTNPGQFFACCGLLELANAIDPDALGWFSGTEFYTTFDPTETLKRLLTAEIAARKMSSKEFAWRCASVSLPKSSTTIDPIIIGKPFNVVIDWWLKPRGATTFKTWSGDKQVPVAILNGLVNAVSEIIVKEESSVKNVMSHLLSSTSRLKFSPFYYDGISSRNPIDTGFLLEKSMKLGHCALVELLTFVAIQRFQPELSPNKDFCYRAWTTPLSVDIAAAVSFGLLRPIPSHQFSFAVTSRDDYHEQFSPAQRSSNG